MYFKLFALQDKKLRETVFSHIARDLLMTCQKDRNSKLFKELQDFFFPSCERLIPKSHDAHALSSFHCIVNRSGMTLE